MQPLGPGTHLGAGLPSAPAAPAAGRRPPTPGPGPAPRAPPWVPAARRRGSPALNFPGARRDHGLKGPGPASERLPALLGAAPAGRPGARRLGPRGGGAAGGGAAARGGAGVAETRRWRPRTPRAFARRTAVPRRHPECPARGRGRSGEEPGRSCPRALDRARQLPAPAPAQG